MPTQWHLPRCAILSDAQKHQQRMRANPRRMHAQKRWYNFSRIILLYKVPPQDVATGEALDAFVTLWQDKMVDAWYNF